MRTLMLNAVLSLFTNGGIPYQSLRTAILDALKNGSASPPNRFDFSGVYMPYSGSNVTLNNQAGPPIQISSPAGSYALFRSHIVSVENYIYPGGGGAMSSGDQFKFTHLFLKSGSSTYLEKSVDVTMDHGDDFVIQSTISVSGEGSGDAFGEAAAMRGIANGSCQEITNIQYTTTSNSSWTNASTLEWDGYTAEASTPALTSSPNSVRLVNTSNQSYATRTPTGTHTSGNSVKFQFDISS